MRILITGFEPFGGADNNPAGDVLLLLPAVYNGVEIQTLLLPVAFQTAGERICRAIDALRPDAVVSLGLAESRPAVSVERIAVNLMDARIPDNEGFQPVDLPVVAGAPDAYFATLPVRALANAMLRTNIPAGLSLTAGAYVCNCVFYRALHHIAVNGLAIPAGFVHVPKKSGEELLPAVLAAVEALAE